VTRHPAGIGVYRADGSDTRLIAHTYDVNPDYYATEFVMPSPDGKVVIFNSNMRSSGRYDLFVAEMPLGGSPPPPPPPSTQNVVWTNLTNVTANGNSVTKTSGCDGCADAGPISSQTITSGDGYVEFQLSANTANGAAGLSNGSTDNTRDDVDFAIARAGVSRRKSGRMESTKPRRRSNGTAVFRVKSSMASYNTKRMARSSTRAVRCRPIPCCSTLGSAPSPPQSTCGDFRPSELKIRGSGARAQPSALGPRAQRRLANGLQSRGGVP